jgi:hypothetical protein
MTCKQFEKLVEQNIHNEDMEYHAQACTMCRRLLSDIKAMQNHLKNIQKPRDSKTLWNRISKAISQPIPEKMQNEKLYEKPKADIISVDFKQNTKKAWNQWGKNIALAAAVIIAFGIGFLTSGNLLNPAPDSVNIFQLGQNDSQPNGFVAYSATGQPPKKYDFPESLKNMIEELSSKKKVIYDSKINGFLSEINSFIMGELIETNPIDGGRLWQSETAADINLIDSPFENKTTESDSSKFEFTLNRDI